MRATRFVIPAFILALAATSPAAFADVADDTAWGGEEGGGDDGGDGDDTGDEGKDDGECGSGGPETAMSLLLGLALLGGLRRRRD